MEISVPENCLYPNVEIKDNLSEYILPIALHQLKFSHIEPNKFLNVILIKSEGILSYLYLKYYLLFQ